LISVRDTAQQHPEDEAGERDVQKHAGHRQLSVVENGSYLSELDWCCKQELFSIILFGYCKGEKKPPAGGGYSLAE
jgi:hypothetical protein